MAHGGRFRVAFSITGSAIEQFRAYCPKVVELLKKLAQTGCVEFLGETYHHSLASLFSQEEFYEQIRLHDALMFETFGMKQFIEIEVGEPMLHAGPHFPIVAKDGEPVAAPHKV